MAICFERGQELVKEDHFPRGLDETVNRVQILVIPPVLLFCCAEQEGVVAALLELYDDVKQRHLRALTLYPGKLSDHKVS